MTQFSENVVLHLSLISGIGPATIKVIIEKVGFDDLNKVYSMRAVDFSLLGFSQDKSTKIVKGLQDRTALDKELDLIAKHKIGWCVLGSVDYPSLLAQIEQPPAVLYYQGANLFDQTQAIAFVGARKADAYARIVVDKLIPGLVQEGWVIVSGGALGVDSFAHDATIKAKGRTIVVLGSGLLHWYPFGNTTLFSQVIQTGGMIVSCFPLSMQPIPSNFPARNRIIAGLSLGTVVVQAEKKSGSLITAEFALEQGKEVFAVPGSIEHGLHDGCHALIQQGAKLVTNVHDILIEFGLVQKTEHSDQQMVLPIGPVDAQERAILDRLLTAKGFEELLAVLDISVEELMQKLFDLSLQGKIEQDIMGLWKRM